LAGPTILGNFVNWGLFGVLALQVYLYYSGFPKDKWLVKTVAYGLVYVQAIQLALSSFDAFEFLIGAGSIRGTMWLTVPIMGSFMAFLVQCFFGWRISLLAKNKIIAMIVWIIATLQFLVSIAAGVFMALPTENGNVLFLCVTGWLALSVICDIMIAISMIVLLSKARGRIISTDAMLSRLITLTIETGFLTATGVVVNALAYWYLQKGGFYVLRPATRVFLGNLYANTLLVNLNQRIKIEGGRGREDTSADSWSTRLTDTSKNLPFKTLTQLSTRKNSESVVFPNRMGTFNSVNSMA